MLLSPGPSVPYWRLSSFYFFYFALLGAWLPFWPLYLQDLGYQAEAIGYLAGVMMATKIVAPNIWGWLADRSNRRMAIVRVGALSSFVIFLGVFLHQSFWWLLLVVAGYSFFWNAILAQFEVVTLSHLPGCYDRYSQIRVWGSIGFVIAVVLLGFVFDWLSVNYLPWILSVLLLGIWLSSLSVNERPAVLKPGVEKPSLSQVLKKPTVIAFFISCFLLQMSHGPYYTFFSVFLDDHGYDRTSIGLLWSLGVMAEVVVFVVMHRLLQRFSLRHIMFASFFLSSLRWFLIAYLADELAVLLFAQILHAASFGTAHAFAVELVRKYFAGGLEGQGMALYSGLSFGAGGAVGAVLSGWVWETQPAATFVAAGLCCALALVVSFWVQTETASMASQA